jgi:hypothetical protein
LALPERLRRETGSLAAEQTRSFQNNLQFQG